MGTPELRLSELIGLATGRQLSSNFGAARDEPVVVVHLGVDEAPIDDDVASVARHELGTLPAVIVGVGPIDHPARSLVDVITEPEVAGADLPSIVDAITRTPFAAVALGLLLRHGDERSIAAGLVAESATYSMLQAGPEFGAWLTTRASSSIAADDDEQGAVVVDRDGDTIVISLNRPHRHNAVSRGMSERLVDALTDALAVPDARVVLRGNGPSFSSGGDLSEFGSFPDPVLAHVTRLSRSAGQLIAMMSGRTEAHLHGNCFGAGIELPAFAGRVVATPDVRIALPEVRLGLVPGAGGTVSLPRRIGRHRTALLALTGVTLDADTALSWGLVDRIDDTIRG